METVPEVGDGLLRLARQTRRSATATALLTVPLWARSSTVVAKPGEFRVGLLGATAALKDVGARKRIGHAGRRSASHDVITATATSSPESERPSQTG